MAQSFEGIKSPSVRISEKWLPLYETLCRKGKSRDDLFYVFEKYTQLYTLCAAIGYSKEQKETIEKSYSPFTLEQLDDDEWLVLQAMACDLEKFDLEIFTDAKRVIKITDELSEAGMQFLVKEYLGDYLTDGVLLSASNLELEINLTNILESCKSEMSLF